MIVLDESIHKQMHRTAIAAWYPGQVVSAVTLRPRSVIKDDAIPMLLLQTDEPTFVTINVYDFWKKTNPHRRYCVICLDVIAERIPEGLIWLQRCLRLPDFSTKAARMGKVIRHRATTQSPHARVARCKR